MKFLPVNIKVIRRRWTEYGYGCERGTGYCKKHHDTHYFVMEWRFLGFKVWSWIMDYEDIPVWASAQQACLGFTEWQSKFKEYIRENGR